MSAELPSVQKYDIANGILAKTIKFILKCILSREVREWDVEKVSRPSTRPKTHASPTIYCVRPY